MIKQKTQLETTVNEKVYIFQCEPTSSLPDALNACNVFRSYLLGRIAEEQEAAKASAEAAKKSEEENESKPT